MGTVSRNFDYSEFEVTYIPELRDRNRIPSREVADNIKALCDNVLQPLRDALGCPVVVNSGYRCPDVNAAVGGVATSQHLEGKAADVHTQSHSPATIAKAVKRNGIPHDQMILYNTFVHLSYNNGCGQRMQLLYDKDYKGERL